MKTIRSLIIALSIAATTVPAQTNNPTLLGGIKEIGGAIATATNWTATAGYGHATKGGNSLAFADVGYNFSENVGLVLGLDNMYGGGKSEWNDVRGGISLSLPVHPFAFLGGTNFLTKVVATPFVADLLATPRSGDSIGNLIVTGAKIDLWKIKNFEVGILGAYEKRSGQGEWSGNYFLVGATLSRKW